MGGIRTRAPFPLKRCSLTEKGHCDRAQKSSTLSTTPRRRLTTVGGPVVWIRTCCVTQTRSRPIYPWWALYNIPLAHRAEISFLSKTCCSEIAASGAKTVSPRVHRVKQCYMDMYHGTMTRFLLSSLDDWIWTFHSTKKQKQNNNNKKKQQANDIVPFSSPQDYARGLQ